jgi:hypothetical protein
VADSIESDNFDWADKLRGQATNASRSTRCIEPGLIPDSRTGGRGESVSTVLTGCYARAIRDFCQSGDLGKALAAQYIANTPRGGEWRVSTAPDTSQHCSRSNKTRPDFLPTRAACRKLEHRPSVRYYQWPVTASRCLSSVPSPWSRSLA